MSLINQNYARAGSPTAPEANPFRRFGVTAEDFDADHSRPSAFPVEALHARAPDLSMPFLLALFDHLRA